jgi:hypothetical protein
MTDRDPLIDFVSAVSGEEYLKVEENLGDGYVRLNISEAERRQAKHDIRGAEDIVVELLRNARDARAGRVFVATSREGDHRTLTVIDDGVGVPPSMQERVFEPRVTSKLESMVTDRWGVHGRGMALFSVRSNATSARIAASDSHRGCAIHVVIDTSELPERSDQSTWPSIERDDSGTLSVVRGPHNILRRVLEFAVEHPGMDVYLGSPVEVLSTLYESARDVLDTSELLFSDDVARFPLWQRPATATDAVELIETAEELGLSVSERTAHRVLAGELVALETVLDLARVEAEPTSGDVTPDIYRDRRGLRLHHTDLADFKRELSRAFDTISSRYYLHLRAEPKVTIVRDEIRVRFEVEKDD